MTEDAGRDTDSRDPDPGADQAADRSTDQDAVTEVLSALADPTRRRILDAIAAHGEATATVLATELPVSRQAIVKHLAVLTRAGLVAGHREGREARYTVLPARLGVTARWMDRVASEWDNRLSAIKRLAEADPATPRPSGSGPGQPGRSTR
jgi:DNA-binding transcriptional ArsR family regulator